MIIIKIYCLLINYNELIEVAREEGKISEDDIQTLVDWRDNLS